jgi:hypothetical protein
MKGLDGRGIREDKLKKGLKEALDEKSTNVDGGVDTKDQAEDGENRKDDNKESKMKEKSDEISSDEVAFEEVRKSYTSSSSDLSSIKIVNDLTSSAIGEEVRVRTFVESNRDGKIVRYEVASIIAWKKRKDQVPVESDETDFEPQLKTVYTPVWQARTKNGTESWLIGTDLIESICRYIKWKRKDADYFEHDSSFLAQE